MRELLAELQKSINEGKDCVYCAVVETRGSTPQKAGAVMLVFPDGSQQGTLGGGCVEAEVKQRALGVLSAGGTPEICSFNLDDNYGWDDGLICGGRMTMLIDPVSAANSETSERGRQLRDYYRRFHELIERGVGCTEAVSIKEESGLAIGCRFLFDESGRIAAMVGTSTVPATVEQKLATLKGRPAPKATQGIAYLPILPRITLLIVGGGHVGQAVGRLAAEADFDVWVLDDRDRFACQDRFPAAKRLMVGDIGTKLGELARGEIDPSFYCLVVTRGHAHDEEALYHLATTPAGFVGMIGSKRKIKMIYVDLIAKGIPAEALANVHAPLGFDIGSQTVPEIAISIVAELIACRNLGTTSLPVRVRVKPGNLGS
jgi:xanthine dehydrogenase accessory factor